SNTGGDGTGSTGGTGGGPICTDNQKSCTDEGDARFCESGMWVLDVCEDSACQDGECADCSPGDTKCDDDGTTPQICSSLGQWVDETECEFSCNSGSCIGVCGPGDIQCNGLEVEVCNEQGQWEYSSTCMGG